MPPDPDATAPRNEPEDELLLVRLRQLLAAAANLIDRHTEHCRCPLCRYQVPGLLYVCASFRELLEAHLYRTPVVTGERPDYLFFHRPSPN